MSAHVPMTEEMRRAIRTPRILADKPLVENGKCHFCLHPLQVKGLWCTTICAGDYEEEKRTLLGG